MISCQPLFEQLKRRNISQYKMEHTYGFSATTLYRLKNKGGISAGVLNDICKALDCRVEDVIVYVPDPEDSPE